MEMGDIGAALGSVISAPGEYSRGILGAGASALSSLLGKGPLPFQLGDRVTGKQLMDALLGEQPEGESSLLRGAANLGTDLLTDPLTYAGAGLGALGRMRGAASLATRANDVNAAREAVQGIQPLRSMAAGAMKNQGLYDEMAANAVKGGGQFQLPSHTGITYQKDVVDELPNLLESFANNPAEFKRRGIDPTQGVPWMFGGNDVSRGTGALAKGLETYKRPSSELASVMEGSGLGYQTPEGLKAYARPSFAKSRGGVMMTTEEATGRARQSPAWAFGGTSSHMPKDYMGSMVGAPSDLEAGNLLQRAPLKLGAETRPTLASLLGEGDVEELAKALPQTAGLRMGKVAATLGEEATPTLASLMPSSDAALMARGMPAELSHAMGLPADEALSLLNKELMGRRGDLADALSRQAAPHSMTERLALNLQKSGPLGKAAFTGATASPSLLASLLGGQHSRPQVDPNDWLASQSLEPDLVPPPPSPPPRVWPSQPTTPIEPPTHMPPTQPELDPELLRYLYRSAQPRRPGPLGAQ